MYMYSFYEITGKIPDSFVDIVRDLFEFQSDAIPARHLITSLFQISVTTVKEE